VQVILPAGEQPVMPKPERTPESVRAVIAVVDAPALPRFDAEWADAVALARDEGSVLPVRRFTEEWWLWAAVRRWPSLATRLRECEQRAARSADRSQARAAAAEIGAILNAAADAPV